MSYQSQFSTFQQTEQAYVQQNAPPGQPVPTFDKGSMGDILTGAHAAVADMLGADIYQAQQAAYLTTATGADLDNKAADYGVARLQAVAATSNAFAFTKNVAATTNITIPGGASILTPPSFGATQVEYQTTQDLTLAVGQTSVAATAVCLTSGSVGNLAANTQMVLGSSVPGIDGVTLTANITSGVDEETDDALRARALEAIQSLAIGTRSWYVAQAKSVSGVSSASVQGGYGGLNGVAVYVVGPANVPCPSTVMTQVQAMLSASAPLTDNPQVLAPTVLAVTPSLSITLLAGVDEATAVANVQAAVQAYVNGIGLGAPNTAGYIYPSAIVTTALAQAGVADAGSVTLNGSSSALVIPANTVPQTAAAGDVTVTVVTP